MREWHRKLSCFCVIPWFWFLATGATLFFITAARETKFSVGDAGSLEAQLEHALTLPADQIKRIEFGKILRVTDAGGTTYFFGESLIGKLDPNPWIGRVARLHRGKFLSLPGQIVFSTVALILFGFVLSGIFLLPKGRKWRGGARPWHRTLGLILTLPLLSMFLTGSLWNLSVQLRGLPKNPPLPVSADEWRAAFTAGRGYDSPLLSLHQTPGAVMAELQDGSRIYFHGHETIALRAWTRAGWIEPIFNIHSGRVFGWPGRAAVFFIALAGIVLGLTGISLQRWRRRG